MTKILTGSVTEPQYFWLKVSPSIYSTLGHRRYPIHDLPSEWQPGDKAFIARTVKSLRRGEHQVDISTTIESIRLPLANEMESLWGDDADNRWTYIMDLGLTTRVRKPFSMRDVLDDEALRYYHPRPTWSILRPQDVKAILEFQGQKTPPHIHKQVQTINMSIPVQYTDEGLEALFREIISEMGHFVLTKWNAGNAGPSWMQEGNIDEAYKRILARIRSNHRSKFPRMPRDHRDLVSQVKLCTSIDMPLRAHAQIALVRIAAVQSGFMTEDDAKWLWHNQK